jgi:hypothetical protein
MDCSKVAVVKRYGSVTGQKKGVYKYFVDLDHRMEVAGVKTVYLDEVSQSSFPSLLLRPSISTTLNSLKLHKQDQQAEVDKSQMLWDVIRRHRCQCGC